MTETESAITIKTLEGENAALRALLDEFEAAKKYKREHELIEAVKARIQTWLKGLLALFLGFLTIMGFTSFFSARDAIVRSFAETAAPAMRQELQEEIRKKLEEKIFPEMIASVQSVGYTKVEELASSTEREVSVRMDALFKEAQFYAKTNNLPAPVRPASIDSRSRPNEGFVLKSFLTESKGAFTINTFRLNVRDAPGGTILGRQTENTRVRIVEDLGEWVRIKVIQ